MPESGSFAERVDRAARFRSGLRQLDLATTEAVERQGLTPSRYVFLLMVKNCEVQGEECTVNKLVKKLMIPQSTVSEYLASLERLNLVRRRQDERDGRKFHLLLTPEGDKAFTAVFEDLRTERELLMDLIA